MARSKDSKVLQPRTTNVRKPAGTHKNKKRHNKSELEKNAKSVKRRRIEPSVSDFNNEYISMRLEPQGIRPSIARNNGASVEREISFGDLINAPPVSTSTPTHVPSLSSLKYPEITYNNVRHKKLFATMSYERQNSTYNTQPGENHNYMLISNNSFSYRADQIASPTTYNNNKPENGQAADIFIPNEKMKSIDISKLSIYSKVDDSVVNQNHRILNEYDVPFPQLIATSARMADTYPTVNEYPTEDMPDVHGDINSMKNAQFPSDTNDSYDSSGGQATYFNSK